MFNVQNNFNNNRQGPLFTIAESSLLIVKQSVSCLQITGSTYNIYMVFISTQILFKVIF